MCGIFGQIGGSSPSDETVRRICALLAHRGPDAHGVHRTEGATLAHTRLSVIDLSPAASQPMVGHDKQHVLTFNGEIYNFKTLRKELETKGHRFRSQSDTEVIVAGYDAWGDGVVERLDGMFAFGLWDGRQQRLLLARDRAGKKPLFWAMRPDGGLVFASEIKGLLAAGIPDSPSEKGIAQLLAYGYAPAPGSMYKAVQQLPPGHSMVFDRAKQGPDAPVRYFHLDFTERPGGQAFGEPRLDLHEATRQVRRLVEDAVAKRLVADVPVGAFLSGGIDSTVVVGVMAQQTSQPVKTFAIGFSGDARYDERPFAAQVARRFGTDHHEFVVEPTAFSLIDELVWHHDGPFGDSSAIPTYVVSKLTRQAVTVALSGDGGDEVFAGYLRFMAAVAAERIPSPLRKAGGLLAGLLPGGLPERSLAGRMRRFLVSAGRSLGDRLASWNSICAFSLAELLSPEMLGIVHPEDVLAFHRNHFAETRRLSPLGSVLSYNFESYLPYDLLVKTDRTSMAHGLEVRSPLLDTDLMKYVAALPNEWKLHGRTTKYILRRAFADLIPDDIQKRGKMGFGMPLGTWFRKELRGFAYEHLVQHGARLHDFVRVDTLARMLSDHVEEKAEHGHALWTLLTLEVWLRNRTALVRPLTDTAKAAPAEIHLSSQSAAQAANEVASPPPAQA